MCRRTSSSDICIRQFRQEDEEQVKALFEQGMLSLVPNFFMSVVFKSMAGRIIWVVLAAAVMRWQYWWWIAVSAAVVWFLVQYWKLLRGFRNYIQSSQEGDLSTIQETYMDKGGTFLVATMGDDEIIGIIGGETHSNENKLEIRRVSVNGRLQGNGLGRLLMESVETYARKLDYTSLFLVCSSEQHAAHALYEKQGFQCVKKTRPIFTSGIYFLTRKSTYWFIIMFCYQEVTRGDW